MEQQQGQPPKPKKCTYCGKAGHSEICRKKQAEQTGQGQQLTCFCCHKMGHIAKKCPEQELFCGEAGQSGMYQRGKVEGKTFEDIHD